MLNEFVTTDAIVEPKPPVKIYLEQIHLRRELDGQINVPSVVDASQTNPSSSTRINAERDEKMREYERLRMENEKLRSEMKVKKNEINVLRGERDSLMKTIAKLDVELTEAEYQRSNQMQKTKK